MIPGWVGEYVGIPFREHGRDPGGCDCWGLIRLVYLERFGRELPMLDAYAGTEDGPAILRLYDEEKHRWLQVPEPREGDVTVLRLSGRPRHFGLVVVPGWMLHVERGLDSCIERYDGPVWRHRLEAFYRLR